MANTTMTSAYVSGTFTSTEDPEVPISTYQYVLPVDLLFSGVILVHNSIILKDYYPERKKLVTSIFMLIAACDMLTAFGSVLRSVPAVIYLLDSNARIPNGLNGLYVPFLETSYACSVFFNVVLSVTKTINIANPFYRINKKVVRVILLIGACSWTILQIAYFFFVFSNLLKDVDREDRCPAQWERLMLFIRPKCSSRALIDIIYEILTFALPSVIVLVCMVIQMYSIRNRVELSAESSHINMTVFLVSMLFVISTLLQTPILLAIAMKGQ